MLIPLGLIGVYPAEATSILGSVSTAFFGAAIPEEIAKFIMLWLLLRKNRYFDEKMDGIVYAVCVSLGFEALENNSILFIINVTPAISGILLIVFLIFCHKMWEYGSKSIKKHLKIDLCKKKKKIIRLYAGEF